MFFQEENRAWLSAMRFKNTPWSCELFPCPTFSLNYRNYKFLNRKYLVQMKFEQGRNSKTGSLMAWGQTFVFFIGSLGSFPVTNPLLSDSFFLDGTSVKFGQQTHQHVTFICRLGKGLHTESVDVFFSSHFCWMIL